MIEFTSLSIRNFLSYGNAATVFDLHNPGTTLIVGENLDSTTHGEGSNGVGKSVLVNAISYALYDKPVSNISKDNLINNQNKANLEVTITFRKDNRYYHVRRCRKMTKSKPAGTFVQLFERDGDAQFTDLNETTLDSSNNTNARIEAILGIPYELFVRIIVFSAMHTPFLDLPARTQVDIIEGLVGLRILTEKGDVLKEQAKITTSNIEYTENEVRKQEAEKERYFRTIRETKQKIIDWDTNNEDRIQQLEQKITEIAHIDFTHEIEIHSKIQTLRHECDLKLQEENNTQKNINVAREQLTKSQQIIRESQSALEKITDVDFDQEQELHAKRDLYRADERDISYQLREVSATLTRVKKAVEKLTGEVAHLQDAKCPYCRQNMPDAKERLISVAEQLKKEEEVLQENTKQQVSLNKVLKVIQTKLSKVNSEITVENLAELNKHREQSGTYEERIRSHTQIVKELTDVIEEYTDEFNKLKQASSEITSRIQQLRKEALTQDTKELDDLRNSDIQYATELKAYRERENPHHSLLAELENNPVGEPDYKKIDELQKLNLHQKFLIKALTKKDSFIRKSLLDKHLQYLNKRLQAYLYELGLPHKVEFTPELTAKISEFDHILDFGNLSNGQRARVNIALSLAFRDYLQSVHSQINICLFDEVLDVGLDTVGVQLAARVLQHKAHEEKSSLYIISHRDEITHSFDHRMVVKLQKGFSYVCNDF